MQTVLEDIAKEQALVHTMAQVADPRAFGLDAVGSMLLIVLCLAISVPITIEAEFL